MSKNNTAPLIGAHMSIAGGFQHAILNGEKIGCTAIQIFTKSNRQWFAHSIPEEDITLFKKTWEKSTVRSVVVHASYLINIGSPNKDTAKKSLTALIKEINRCDGLGITYLILHPGARLTFSLEECLDQIAENLNAAFEQTNNNVIVALETMAGQGSTVGNKFEDLAYLIKNIKHKKRIGVALDTCHLFAAGYDLTTEASCKKTFKEFDKIIGLHYLKVIHLNDSKRELATCVDRHEKIGEGKIGLECFKYIMNNKKLIDIPKILETPDTTIYEAEIRLLKNLLI